jgi:diadenosine tetraphosphatase ApaH/serine/threonine PP2A family protein phosphatase
MEFRFDCFRCFGFYDECIEKYGNSEAWLLMTSTYEFFPLAATVDQRLFCCHGGLSPDFSTIEEVQNIETENFNNVSYDGALCDLLWSDPNPAMSGKDWEVSPRGAGYYFGTEITKQFL